MAPLGLAEVCRTGIAAVSRGAGSGLKRRDVPRTPGRLRRLRGGHPVHARAEQRHADDVGLNFGFSRTLPHAFGVALGFGFLVLVVGLGLGAVFAAYPAIYSVLKFAGAAYLLYLAWRIAMGPVAGGGRGRPLTFIEGAAFQWINPKGWVMAIGAVTAYAAIAGFPVNMVLIAALFAFSARCRAGPGCFSAPD